MLLYFSSWLEHNTHDNDLIFTMCRRLLKAYGNGCILQETKTLKKKVSEARKWKKEEYLLHPEIL